MWVLVKCQSEVVLVCLCVYVCMLINEFSLWALHSRLHIPLPCALCDKDEYRLGQKSCRTTYTRGQDRCVLACEWYTSVHGLEAVQYLPTETQQRYQFMLLQMLPITVDISVTQTWLWLNANLQGKRCAECVAMAQFFCYDSMWHAVGSSSITCGEKLKKLALLSLFTVTLDCL